MIAGMAMLVAGAALAAPPEQQKPAQQLPGPPPPVTAGAPDIAPVSPSVYSTGTVAQFLNVCGNDQGGCADEVGTVLIDKMSFDGRSNICLPGPDYALPALQWLKTHPEAQSMPTEDGVFLALQKTYPCT
jgi:hypothetical protein